MSKPSVYQVGEKEETKLILPGFDKQMDVVNLYDLAGHSPACFWIGGYESDPLNNVSSYQISEPLN